MKLAHVRHTAALLCGLPAALWCPMGDAAGGVATAIGVRKLDDGFWQSVASQPGAGLLVDLGPAATGLRVTLGAFSSSDGADFMEAGNSGSVDELFIGLKYQPGRGRFRPYVGAGAAQVDASFQRNPSGGSIFGDYYTGEPAAYDDDSSSGYYLGAGATLQVAKGFNIALHLHHLGGTSLELLGTQTDADGLSASLAFGWSWGDWMTKD
jgi:hypothetical protein